MKKNPPLTKEDFEKLKSSTFDLEKEKDEQSKDLKEIYLNLVDILREYIDMKEGDFEFVALWILGTYFHQDFFTYPYLFLNATKGSGKTRLLKIIKFFSKNGEMLNSLTEAVLFRTTGTLCIDEFEGIGRKGGENLRELLNSAYKKGTKVKRMKQQKTSEGVRQVVEEFDVYRPIAIANIWGMENVLSDRCIKIILETSSNKRITNLIELFEYDFKSLETKKILDKLFTKKKSEKEGKEMSLVSLVSFSWLLGRYQEWNEYVRNSADDNNTNNININNNINNINNICLFESIKNSRISGRNLELCFPLIILSDRIGGKELVETTLKILSEIINEKMEEDCFENIDNTLIEYVSKITQTLSFTTLNSILEGFRKYLGTNEDWVNSKWLGRALIRLNLILQTRRSGRGREVILNIKKAKEKLNIFT